MPLLLRHGDLTNQNSYVSELLSYTFLLLDDTFLVKTLLLRQSTCYR